jgi:hypothetical protein
MLTTKILKVGEIVWNSSKAASKECADGEEAAVRHAPVSEHVCRHGPPRQDSQPDEHWQNSALVHDDAMFYSI